MLTILQKEDFYNLLTGRTPMALNRVLMQNFKNHQINLTPEQWSVLAVLWENDGCSQQFLANETYRDKPSITRLIDNLEKENLVKRMPDSNDRRMNNIYITQEGIKIKEKVMMVVHQTIEIALKDIAVDRIQNLRETSQFIYENLTNYSNK